jgi:choline kinase
MIETAVILAAGSGTRLKPLTDHSPKCLTEINSIPILSNALENLDTLGIKECTVVAGYYAEKISRAIGNSFRNVRVHYLLNQHYASTNDMYSLWLARHLLERGVILLEGDIFFRYHTIERAFSLCANRTCYLAGKYNGKKDEILISADADKKVRSIEVLRGRSGTISDHHYMSTGILIIQGDYGTHLSHWLTEFIAHNAVNVLFDDVMGAHTDEGELLVFEVGHDEWVEVDTIEDVREAERVFA